MKNTVLKFPPFWAGIVFISIGIIGMCIMLWLGWEPTHPAIDGRIFLVILCCLMLSCFVSYSITQDSIRVKFLGIPVRKIRWTDIRTVVFSIANKEGKPGQSYIILAVHPGRIDVLTASRYMQKGYMPTANTLRLRIPIGQEEYYISEIRHCIDQVGDIEVFSGYQ